MVRRFALYHITSAWAEVNSYLKMRWIFQATQIHPPSSTHPSHLQSPASFPFPLRSLTACNPQHHPCSPHNPQLHPFPAPINPNPQPPSNSPPPHHQPLYPRGSEFKPHVPAPWGGLGRTGSAKDLRYCIMIIKQVFKRLRIRKNERRKENWYSLDIAEDANYAIHPPPSPAVGVLLTPHTSRA